MTVTIKTNNVPRDTYYIWQLTDKEQKQIREKFDYYTEEEELEDQSFFKYQGYWYCIGDFLRVQNNETFKGWDGYHSDSYFSGQLIKLVTDDYDNDQVICGRFCS